MDDPGATDGVERLRSGRRVAMAVGDALVLSVAGGPSAAASAREELRDHLAPTLDPETVELVELLLSELVNNCVLHGAAAGPDALIHITASAFPHVLWVEVCDGGPSFRHVPEEPPPEAESGRGLYLVQQLASQWGISENGAARVWFELPIAFCVDGKHYTKDRARSN